MTAFLLCPPLGEPRRTASTTRRIASLMLAAYAVCSVPCRELSTSRCWLLFDGVGRSAWSRRQSRADFGTAPGGRRWPLRRRPELGRGVGPPVRMRRIHQHAEDQMPGRGVETRKIAALENWEDKVRDGVDHSGTQCVEPEHEVCDADLIERPRRCQDPQRAESEDEREQKRALAPVPR